MYIRGIAVMENRITYLIRMVSDENSQAAFEELHKVYFAGLLSFAISMLKDRHLAEEVIEDVFVNLWTNRKMLPTVNNLSSYLYISVKHTCLNTLKSRSFNVSMRKTVLGEVGEEHYAYLLHTPEEMLISNQNLKLISDAINTLPPKCRLVFRLVKEDGMKYKEVAELLNISTKTVQNHMIKAMSIIVDRLKNLFPEYYSQYSTKSAVSESK